MKVLLFRDDEKVFAKSGVGRAMKHQEIALKLAGVDFTTNSNDEFDIIHLNTINPKSYLLANKAHRNGKKVIFHAHSTEEDFRNSFALSNLAAPAFKKWLIKCYNTADLLLTPTEYSRDLLSKYNLIKAPIIPISNGIDLSQFSKNPDKIKAFREYFKLKKNDKVVISVGHYFERKGLPDFMAVAREFPDVKFIWFGFTPAAMLTENVKKTIRKKPANVILPGYISGEIIQGAFASADLFFFPSYEETEGIVVLEALAAKCQVLVRNIGVYDSWLIKDKNCLMGENNDEFIEQISSYFNREITSTIEEGYKVARSRSLEKIGVQLKDIYENLFREN